ncbi:MAG: NADP-dependent oxidoreductase [Hyphomonadaceae bacterium]
MPLRAREIRLKSRPVGVPTDETYEIVTIDLSDPGAGQVLVRNLWMSVDPYMRGRMYDLPSYAAPYEVGKALHGGAIGEVVASGDPAFKPGDRVLNMLGWREGFLAPGSKLEKIPEGDAPLQAYLGVLGMPGLTAYVGLLELGQPKAGETVFVSGGAGAVGAVVAQIAKIKGCTVVASVGSDEKGAWLKARGIDAVINYKTCGKLLSALRAAAPKGIDIYFDNVGGAHLEAAFDAANTYARFVECGMISQYNNLKAEPGPRGITNIITKSLNVRGYVVSDYERLKPQFFSDMTQWIKEGKIQWEETVEHGLDNAPRAFASLFSGGNTGKMLVKLT